uniref:Uncharacterized protein n=1 Tax=Hymenolepis diminuta TaxID=6216 RepID=A0A0R3SMU3_HYMDI
MIFYVSISFFLIWLIFIFQTFFLDPLRYSISKIYFRKFDQVFLSLNSFIFPTLSVDPKFCFEKIGLLHIPRTFENLFDNLET